MSSNVISVILNMKNELSQNMQPAIESLRSAREATSQATTNLETYRRIMAQAKQNYEEQQKAIDILKSSVIGQNSEYINAKNGLNSLKRANNDIEKEIQTHSIALAELGRTYGTNSTEYKSTEAKLKALRAEHRTNATAIKEQSVSLTELEKNLIENSEAIKQAREQEKVLKNAVESAKKSITDQSKEIARLGNAMRETGREIEKSKEQMKEWGRSIATSIDGAIKSVAKWGTVMATGLGVVGFKKGLETSINLEAYRTMLETATKDFEKTNKLMKNAEKLSISTPFDPEEVIQATATLESYGIDSERWLTKIADAAGATNRTMEEATNAVKDVLSKNEFQSLENLGISKQMVMKQAEVMYGKNKVFDNKGGVKDNEKLKVVLEEIMVSKFDGGADKLSRTIKGLWSTITGSINMGLAKILGMENGLIKSGSILDIIKQKMKQISDIILKWESDGTLDKLSESFTKAFQSISDGVVAAFNFIKDNSGAIKALVVLFGTVYAGVKVILALKTAVEAYKIAVFALSNISFLVGIFNKVKLAVMGFNLALNANPIGLIITGVGALCIGLYTLYKNFDKVKAFCQKMWDKFKAFADSMPGWAKVVVSAMFPIINVIRGLVKLWGWVKGTFFKDKEEQEKSLEVTKNVTAQIQEVAPTKTQPQTPKQAFEESYAKAEVPKTLNDTKASQIFGTTQGTQSYQPVVVTPEKKRSVNINNTININGDFYGYSDFKEKVSEVLVDIINNNMSNIA